MGSLFSFDKLITPSIIKILFYIGVGIVALSAFCILLFGLDQPSFSPIPGFLFLFPAALVLVVGRSRAR